MLRLFLGTLFFIFASNSKANGQIDAAQEARHFTVQISNQLFYPIEARHQAFSGTGFVVEISGDKVLVFTNEHVIRRPFLTAQEFTISVAPEDENERPEEVPAQLVFTSPLRDFAILEFRLSDLSRNGKYLRVAPLSQDKISGKSSSLKSGSDVMAFGNPMNLTDTSTFGHVTGRHEDHDGVFLQTSAPINPGNSGGPLIDLLTKTVIGINTSVFLGRDGLGFALPIDMALQDFNSWRASAVYETKQRLPIIFGFNDAANPKRQVHPELLRLILEKNPKYFAQTGGYLTVRDKISDTPLKIGDIVYSCNGQIIGTKIYELQQLVQSSTQARIRCEIIRNGAFQEIEVPIVKLYLPDDRGSWNFVLVAGMILGEMPSVLKSTHELKGIEVFSVIPGSEASEKGVEPGSIIQYIQHPMKGVFQINSLADLKSKLSLFKDKELMRIGLLPALIPESDDNGPDEGLHVNYFMSPTIGKSVNLLNFRYHGFLTEEDFQLSRMLREININELDPNFTWQDYVRPKKRRRASVCEGKT